MNKIFTFHKINNTFCSCWLCLINNDEAIKKIVFRISQEVLQIYMAIKKSDPNIYKKLIVYKPF